jgi:hypothetical protein
MNLEDIDNSEGVEVLIKSDNEGTYVDCPWLNGEKIAVNGECEFVNGHSCKNYRGKKWSENVNYIRCNYRPN